MKQKSIQITTHLANTMKFGKYEHGNSQFSTVFRNKNLRVKKVANLLFAVLLLLMVDLANGQPLLTGKVVYHSYSNYDNWDAQLYVLDLSTRAITNISSGWNIDHEMNANVSPDGKTMVFMGDIAGDGTRKWDIFIWTIGQGVPRNLTAGNGQRDEDPKFSPDGTKIVFKEAGEIKIMDLNGNVLSNVTNSSTEESMPYYTSDGSAILYAQGARTTSDIYKINTNGTGKVALVTTSETSDYYPVTRDNNTFYYTRWLSASDMHDQIYLYNYANGSSTRLPFNTSDADYSDACAVNSQYLILVSSKAGGRGGYDLYIADVNSGQIWSLDSYNTGVNSTREELGAYYFQEGSTPPPTQTPYTGSAIAIPGKVESENYDKGGQNIAYFDNTSGNSGGVYRSDDVDIEGCSDVGGGYNLGYTATGEWMEYSINVTQTGTYDFQFRVSSAVDGSQIKVLIDGIDKTGIVTLPNTGGWQSWQTVSVNNISITAGQKILQIYNVTGGFNLNYLNIANSSQVVNLALNKSVTVSSTEVSGLEGSKAVDGNPGTRWSSSFADPQWIYVDLGATYSISRVKLTWEAAYGKNFTIQTSTNASSWTTIKTITGNTSLVNDLTGLSGSGRYVRMYGTARGTAYGYSLYEFEVYGTVLKAAASEPDVQSVESSLFSVYPNPVSDVLRVKLGDEGGQANIRIYSLSGSLLYWANTDNQLFSIDVTRFKSKGLVMVSVSKNNQTNLFKVVVK